MAEEPEEPVFLAEPIASKNTATLDDYRTLEELQEEAVSQGGNDLHEENYEENVLPDRNRRICHDYQNNACRCGDQCSFRHTNKLCHFAVRSLECPHTNCVYEHVNKETLQQMNTSYVRKWIENASEESIRQITGNNWKSWHAHR